MIRMKHGIVGVLLLIAIPALFSCHEQASVENLTEAHLLDTAFWIWNRSHPLTESELIGLKEAKVKQIFWQLGEVEVRDGQISTKARWRFRTPLPILI